MREFKGRREGHITTRSPVAASGVNALEKWARGCREYEPRSSRNLCHPSNEK